MNRLLITLGFLLGHVLLVLGMRVSSHVATLHALSAVGLGLAWVWTSRDRASAAFVVAYIAGAEALWRMTGANVFWEFGKYATVLILVVAWARHGRFAPPVGPMLFFALLLPSVILTVSAVGLVEARGFVSFNLSGPLSLAVCCIYFSRVQFNPADLRRFLLCLSGPILGVAVGCLAGIVSKDQIEFGTESNYETSGGYGPNQVSSLLGMGMLSAFLFYNLYRRSMWEGLVWLAILLFCAAQSALTFSRTGVYIGMATILIAAFYLARNRKAMLGLLSGVTVFVGVGFFIVFPFLNMYTGGNLSERFQEKNVSNRDIIAKTDLQLWLMNPIAGTGPGMCKVARKEAFGFGGVAHTEFTRLFAEHGMFGGMALLVLLQIGWKNYFKAAGTIPRAIVSAFLTFTFLFMIASGMRLVLPAVSFGLSCSGLIVAKRRTLSARTTSLSPSSGVSASRIAIASWRTPLSHARKRHTRFKSQSPEIVLKRDCRRRTSDSRPHPTKS